MQPVVVTRGRKKLLWTSEVKNRPFSIIWNYFWKFLGPLLKICTRIKWIVRNRQTKLPPYEPSRLFKVSQENWFHQIFEGKSVTFLSLLSSTSNRRKRHIFLNVYNKNCKRTIRPINVKNKNIHTQIRKSYQLSVFILINKA